MRTTGEIYDTITAELFRQHKLKEQGRFQFTSANTGITDPERMLILLAQVGKLNAEVMANPSSGMMPVTHAGVFDWRKAGYEAGYQEQEPENIPTGTLEDEKRLLVTICAVCVGWIDALESASDGRLWKPQTAEDSEPGRSTPEIGSSA